MNSETKIKFTKHPSRKAISVETDFNQIIVHNFDEICKAIASHVNSLCELKELSRQGIQTEELLAVIMESRNLYTAAKKICQNFGVNDTTANLILDTKFSNLNLILDSHYLDSCISQHKDILATTIMPLIS